VVIAEAANKHSDKPVVDVPADGEDFRLMYEMWWDTSISVYSLPEKVAKALKTLPTYYQITAKAKD